MVVSSSSGPAGFALVFRRPRCWLGWAGAPPLPLIVLFWVGFVFASSGYSRLTRNRPRTRIVDFSSPSTNFVDHVPVPVTTIDRRAGRGAISPAAGTAFALVFAVPSEGGSGSAEAPAVATAVAQYASPLTSTSEGADVAAIADPATPTPSPPHNPDPLTVLPPLGCISSRTR